MATREPRLPGGEDDASPRLVPDDGVVEQLEAALEEGDQPIRAGSVRTLLGYRDFRYAFGGAVASNIGTWMQNVVLAAYAYELTGSAAFVGVVAFINMIPQFLFAMVGGTLADALDRRRIIIVCSLVQLVLAFALAGVVAGDEPTRGLLLVLVFAIGTAAALQSPASSSLLPTLVPRREIPGAISLQSANLNLSRVLGPAIGGVLYAAVGPSWVFVGNGVTYLFLILGMWAIRTPPRAAAPTGVPVVRRLLSGFGIVWADPVLRRTMACMTVFALFCLAFVTQFPVQADENFGIDPETATFGLLYATFAAGSLVGALGVGFFLGDRAVERLVRGSLVAFSLSLLLYGAIRSPLLAFPAAFVVGITYFAVITSLMTIVQHRVDDAARGRVMAVWLMLVGGMMPLGGLISGWIVDATSPTVICVIGAVAGAALVPFADLREREPGIDGASPAVA
jgi:MFS family permease